MPDPFMTRAQRRTLSFGLQTVLGLRKRGYFIPMRNAAASAAWDQRPFDALVPIFRRAEDDMIAHLFRIDALAHEIGAIVGPPPEPRFDQSWFPRLDAAALYAMVRHLEPARIVEVGSGHSTRFIARAIRDAGLGTTLTAIDPQPRADLEGLPITLIRKTVQEAGLAPFDLAAGDMLIVDSSHVLMPGTDVDLMLNHVIPALPAGAVVMFHDIFLPAPYPSAWPFTAYNEQNAVAPLIGGRADLLFASAYVVAQMPGALGNSFAGSLPLVDGARESALFLRLK
ncbi:class I SAM-dependent methyltransferase [Acuticoccus sp. M5D2P5]|uniref:class I SAM-dependent methyltransferase n=1 Tax=Acuticoccus kalidii TaxID=2910977 RepID=UPI001F1DA23A|nr:class I SAM-dependent methyltransferase [Acuticoccus kalidii]MCF3933470.1 class I SAM-dependent methyltransferase [Acuticoccus kalidii]